MCVSEKEIKSNKERNDRKRWEKGEVMSVEVHYEKSKASEDERNHPKINNNIKEMYDKKNLALLYYNNNVSLSLSRAWREK